MLSFIELIHIGYESSNWISFLVSEQTQSLAFASISEKLAINYKVFLSLFT